MTTITAPDGTVVTAGERTEAPWGIRISGAFHGATARHVAVTESGALIFGFADAQIHPLSDTAAPADRLAEMAAIGRAITEQAEKALAELPAPDAEAAA